MSKLKDIHILTEAEYNALQTISQNDLYFVEESQSGWTIFNQRKTILEESPVATGTPTAYTLSDLPDANGEYELLLCASALTGTASGNLCRVNLYPTNDINNVAYAAATRTRSSSAVEDRATFVYPIKGNIIYADIEGTAGKGTGYLWWYGYRQIG